MNAAAPTPAPASAVRWLGFTLLAAGCVAAAWWGPAQLWPTTAAPDGVYGRAGDGPSGLALLSAQAEKGALQAMPLS